MIAVAQPATPAQINFLRKLDTEYCDLMVQYHEANGNAQDARVVRSIRESIEMSYETETKKNASVRIDKMKDHVAGARSLVAKLPKAETPVAEKVELEDGIYFLDGDVIKVIHAVHGSGNQYAKRLDVNDRTEKGNARFVYAPGLIRKLTPEHRMTKEQAIEFGKLYGVCTNCARTLTAEDSIERAMGPVCAGKFA